MAYQASVYTSVCFLSSCSCQENLQQLILVPLPNVAVLGRDPLTGRYPFSAPLGHRGFQLGSVASGRTAG